MSADFYGEAAVCPDTNRKQFPRKMFSRSSYTIKLMTLSEEGSGSYPRSMCAASVLDILRQAINAPAPNITLLTDTRFSRPYQAGPQRRSGMLRLRKEHSHARNVLLAAGGFPSPEIRQR